MSSPRLCQFRSLGAAFLGLALVSLLQPASAEATDELPAIRVGTLKFGTVNWELDVMARHGFDRAHGFALDQVDYAGKDGAAVALQGGAVDVVLTDWLWVAKRRAMGGGLTFVPHSHLTGGLMVRRDSGIAGLADLKGRKIGIGGGPVDKSWILLRAYALKSAGFDPAHDSTPVFAAPPLLNETLKRGGVPAALNFWQYNARLPEAEFVELIKVADMLPALGLSADLPLLGWVFSDRWAAAHPELGKAYLAAATEARHLLANSPEEWRAIKPLTQAEDAPMLERLRQAYAAGIMTDEPTGAADLTVQAQRMIDLLVRLGDRDDAPPDGKLPPGTFFAGFGS
jgi:NitT/TauT family transport system substrate-binding protein